MSWPCSAVSSRGERCKYESLYRLHFSLSQPFDHIDVCDNHLEEYIAGALRYQYFLPDGSLSSFILKENLADGLPRS